MLRKLFILFIAAWLPLQGVSALAMPYGGAGVASGVEQAAESDASAVHWHEGRSHHGGHGAHASSSDASEAGMAHDDHATSSVGCERCGLCQFVHGGVMINSAVALPAVPALRVFSAPVDERFSAYIPEQPQRPPLSAA